VRFGFSYNGRFAGTPSGRDGSFEMGSNASDSSLGVLKISLSDEEDDIGLTPLTRPGTPLIIGSKQRLRPHEIIVPPHTAKDDFQPPWLSSPSSSDLLEKNIFSPRTLTRSRTVPAPLVTATTIKFEDTMMEALVFEPEKLVRLRRWILAIEVGTHATQHPKLGRLIVFQWISIWNLAPLWYPSSLR